jgi:sodium transport system permease protein
MNALLIVFAKEMLESLRDRRTLLTTLLLGPVFMPVMFSFMTHTIIKQVMDGADEKVTIAAINADAAPNLRDHLATHGVTLRAFAGDDAAARAAVVAGTEKLVLEVPQEHAQRVAAGETAPLRLYYDSSNRDKRGQIDRVESLLREWNQRIAVQRLVLRGVDPRVLSPIPLQQIDVSTPAGRSVLLLGMLSFFLVISMFASGISVAIDGTAGERERGSLEALLTLPVRREVLLGGKLLATAAMMTIALLLTTTGLTIALSRIGLEQLGMSANFGPATAFLMAAILLPLVPVGAGLLTLVASFARSIREAQAWVGIAQLLPTMPLAFVSMLNPTASPLLMCVPSLSQHLLIMKLLRAEALAPLDVALSVGSSLLMATLLIGIAMRLYRRESLLG